MLQDLSRNLEFSQGSGFWSKVTCLGTLRYQSVFLFRLSQAAGAAIPLFGFVIKQINQALTGADLAWQARVGDGLILFHPNGVVIGADTELGDNASIQQGVTVGGYGGVSEDGSSPKIGNDVLLGAGCKIIGALSIGDGAKIGANAVVLRDVPPFATAVGVPARIVPGTEPLVT